MLKSFARGRALVRSAAIPLLAAVVFSFGWGVSPAPDGGFAPAAAEAKSDKAKGGKTVMRSSKSDRKAGKKERTAKTGRKKDRTAKSDRKKDRAAKADRKPEKAERRTAKADRKIERKAAKSERGDTAAAEETASVEEQRDDYWEEQDRRYGEDDRQADDHGYSDEDGHADDDGYDDGEEVVSKRNWGATASQLKHRNAANANENAFRNASPNSNVGRIASYREAARATIDQESAIGDLNRQLDDLHYERQVAEAEGDFDRIAEIDDEVLRIEEDRHYAAEELDRLRLAEDDAYRAVGGPELDDNDYAVFRRMLGLQ